ncbi:Oidioi.mRNA.OKI2018_I69.PAR.g9448.t1.cds [Oikopleura dioica]|uniref:Oidioi.mRNA.OKI2018_I69.PAR.g9448.t1.cds n=1 Tax=Oikopleura dioica TaxID=34765 RepID=A0ABN7RKL3_OIKDI|nr:Oidioi.mRNA.OKI2018_I69.PAR.g9448.t1.cds [Oikopleura dioica]
MKIGLKLGYSFLALLFIALIVTGVELVIRFSTNESLFDKPDVDTYSRVEIHKNRSDLENKTMNVTTLYGNSVKNGTMSILPMFKDAAHDFCASMNMSLPTKRVRVIDAPENFGIRTYWLDVNFTFPEISVPESPLKNEAEKILRSFKLYETQVYLLRLPKKQGIDDRICARAQYCDRERFFSRRFVCEDNMFDEKNHYHLLNDEFLNETYNVIYDNTSSFPSTNPSFYLGNIEDFSASASGIRWCPTNPLKPIGLADQNKGLLALFPYSNARAICF